MSIDTGEDEGVVLSSCEAGEGDHAATPWSGDDFVLCGLLPLPIVT